MHGFDDEKQLMHLTETFLCKLQLYILPQKIKKNTMLTKCRKYSEDKVLNPANAFIDLRKLVNLVLFYNFFSKGTLFYNTVNSYFPIKYICI